MSQNIFGQLENIFKNTSFIKLILLTVISAGFLTVLFAFVSDILNMFNF